MLRRAGLWRCASSLAGQVSLGQGRLSIPHAFAACGCCALRLPRPVSHAKYSHQGAAGAPGPRPVAHCAGSIAPNASRPDSIACCLALGLHQSRAAALKSSPGQCPCGASLRLPVSPLTAAQLQAPLHRGRQAYGVMQARTALR